MKHRHRHRGQVLHSYFFHSLFYNPTHGRIVNIKGLSNLLHAVAARGVGLHDGWVARRQGYTEPAKTQRRGVAGAVSASAKNFSGDLFDCKT